MKKHLALLSAFLLTFSIFGQTEKKLPAREPEEYEIGSTYYNLQSNAALSNRFYRYDDGRMVATWTGLMELWNINARGSFYSYWDGNEWGLLPEERIEEERSGWPSYAPLGNGEVVASHALNGMVTITNIYTRNTVGQGTWNKKTLTPTLENEWPRICTNDGVIHLIAADQQNINNEIASSIHYFRSSDGGNTWNPERVKFANYFPNYDYNDFAFTSDNYVWAEPINGIIAFSLTSAFGDIMIYKSADNGNTWQKITVWENPVKGYSPTNYSFYAGKQLYCPNGAQSLIIDEEGKCHLTFCVKNITFGSEYYKNYETEKSWSCALYWNEQMPKFTNSNPYLALNPDENELYFEDGRLILMGGFDFDGDGLPFSNYNNIVLYRNSGIINNIHMAVAGSHRIIFALEVQDERAIFPINGDMYSRIFACSYINDGVNWKFDKNWIFDPTMAGYDLYTGAPTYNEGWLSVNKGNYNEFDNCLFPQILVEKSEYDEGKFYIFFQTGYFPGETGLVNVENYILMYSDFVSLPAAPTIITANLPKGKVGISYHKNLFASGTSPITWNIESGALPTGLNLDENTGNISGIPATAGTFHFVVKAVNSLGDDTKALSIVVEPTITITTTSLPDGIVGVEYSETLSAEGETPITWSIESGALPDGLSLNENSGEISGTPTVDNAFSFVVKATNLGGNDTKAFEMNVTLSINTLQNSSIKIYPNPAKNILHIESEDLQPIHITFYDLQGKEILNKEINGKADIDISSLPSGIYNVNFQHGNNVENRRIVKQ